MTRGRKPRRARAVRRDPIAHAIGRATLLTADEVANTMRPIEAAHKALREGVATELQWQLLCSAVEIGQAIEDLRVVRGLREHLVAGELALDGVRGRAMATGSWKPTALYYQELDNVAEAVRLHRYQLQHLSYGELQDAARRAMAKVRQAGGIVSVVDEEAPA